VYVCKDERPNAIKNGVGKIGNMAARSKRKIEEKQERKLASASRSLYTLAAIIIKFKKTKN